MAKIRRYDDQTDKQQIGRQLLDHVRGTRQSLTLGVFEDNHLARGFYEHYGFVAVGRVVSAVEGHIELRMEYTPGM